MKRLLLTLTLVCMLLLTASMPAYATPPTVVSGGFDYTYDCPYNEWRGGNLFLWCTEEVTYTGPIEGVQKDEYVVIFHASGLATFSSKGQFEGSVLGKEGTLETQATGILLPGATGWKGTVSMQRGTGDLANAHVQGKWHETGGTPQFTYDFLVHFDP